jgi:thiamine-phosphate pyrophosphorylase
VRACNLALYLVTDRDLARGRDLIECVLEAVAGGATMVQLRDKNISAREVTELARRLVQALRPHRIPLIINDRIDITLAVKAAGAHIGQDDLPIADARRMLRRRVLGVSVQNAHQAREAEKLGADYLGAGPVYATNTKIDYHNTIGADGLRDICDAVRIPVAAIGGIHAANIGELAAIPRLAGVSVVSAILAADDVQAAARGLKFLWENTPCPR